MTSGVPQCTSILNFSTIGQNVTELLMTQRILTARFLGEEGSGEGENDPPPMYDIHVRDISMRTCKRRISTTDGMSVTRDALFV